MGSGWVHISPLPVPYPYIEIGENPNPYPNPVKSGKTRQIGVGLGRYLWARILLPCLKRTHVSLLHVGGQDWNTTVGVALTIFDRIRIVKKV